MTLVLSRFAKAELVFQFLILAYGLAFCFYAWGLLARREADRTYAIGRFVFGVAWIANAYAVVGRGIEAGRPPIKTFYESLIYFAFLFGLLSLLVEQFRRVRLLGTLCLTLILGALGYALVRMDLEIVTLPPALQSTWFLPHVTVYFAAYSAVTAATVLGILALLRPEGQTLAPGSFWHRALGERQLDFEALMMAWIRVGFLLLTAGLVTGGLWAKFAWSDYWAWDPKENWGLVSWLAYALVLHFTHVRLMKGRRVVLLALGAWVLVLFTYFGMALLPTRAQSMHIYTEGSRAAERKGP
jgi:cytochrome c-type biogenesis protein CcsB